MTRITRTLHEDIHICMIISRSVLPRMRNFLDKIVEEIKTHILQLFFFHSRAVHQIMWKNIVEADRPQMTIWRMRIACWIPKATNTRSEYVILIAFNCSSGCTNAPQCYAIRTLPLMLMPIGAIQLVLQLFSFLKWHIPLVLRSIHNVFLHNHVQHSKQFFRLPVLAYIQAIISHYNHRVVHILTR
jgi:hypothetical protein